MERKMACVKCGKDLSKLPAISFHINLEKAYMILCDSCFKEYDKSLKECSKCAYYEDKSEIEELICYCKKIGLQLKPHGTVQVIFSTMNLYGPYHHVYRRANVYLDAEKCIHYTEREMYREKALRGEVETVKETHYVVCNYCGVRYDANMNIKCPNCGAINP